MLYQAQENHQHTAMTIVGHIESQNCKLISALQKLLKSHKYRLLEVFKGTDNQTHPLVCNSVEQLQSQQHRLVEDGTKQTEQLIHTLTADLFQDM
jgi:hypothetical protein